MDTTNSVVAVFDDHITAENAVKSLAAGGFEMTNLSVVGKGFHTEEKVVGFYNIGDRVKFWGVRGAFWGGLWGLFFGGLFLTLPITGPVIVVGYLSTVVIAAIENAVVIGGLGALGAALYSIGVPKDSVIEYERDLKADGYLVMARGSTAEVDRAKAILAAASALRVDVHAAEAPAGPVPAAA